MISLTILFIVFIGLLETVRLATEFNLRNAVNSEAIRIADNAIATYRTMPFASIPASSPPPAVVERRVRRTNVQFNVQVTPTGGNITRTVNVTVTPLTPRFGMVRPTSFTTVIRNPGAL